MDYKAILEEQINILVDWNRENAKYDNVQVRVNAETIIALVNLSVSLPPANGYGYDQLPYSYGGYGSCAVDCKAANETHEN